AATATIVFPCSSQANSFGLNESTEHYKKYLQWRVNLSVDNISKRHIPQLDLLRAVIPFALHGAWPVALLLLFVAPPSHKPLLSAPGYAKDGCPLYIDKTGKVHCFAASQVDMDQ